MGRRLNIRRIARWAQRKLLEEPQFATSDVKIGKHVQFGKNVVFKSKTVRIGDGVKFRDNVLVEAEHFEIGDYGTIYDYCQFPGGRVTIGHNFWLGSGAIVDGRGGTVIGNNVGIGAHSQLWTHMIFGDVMYGCRFHSIKNLVVEDDAWIVGHCLISPVNVGARSLAMLGSLITKDMKPDCTYAGVPAKEITDKAGLQFRETSVDERLGYMEQRLKEFALAQGIGETHRIAKVVSSPKELAEAQGHITVFNVADRTYRKTRSDLENRLIRFLLPEAKFIPNS